MLGPTCTISYKHVCQPGRFLPPVVYLARIHSYVCIPHPNTLHSLLHFYVLHTSFSNKLLQARNAHIAEAASNLFGRQKIKNTKSEREWEWEWEWGVRRCGMSTASKKCLETMDSWPGCVSIGVSTCHQFYYHELQALATFYYPFAALAAWEL